MIQHDGIVFGACAAGKAAGAETPSTSAWRRRSIGLLAQPTRW